MRCPIFWMENEKRHDNLSKAYASCAKQSNCIKCFFRNKRDNETYKVHSIWTNMYAPRSCLNVNVNVNVMLCWSQLNGIERNSKCMRCHHERARALTICLHKQMTAFQQGYWNHKMPFTMNETICATRTPGTCCGLFLYLFSIQQCLKFQSDAI